MRNNLRVSAAVAMVACAVMSCLPGGLVWIATCNFQGGRWSRDSRISFRPDTAALLKAGGDVLQGIISLRYAPDASVESLPLVVETENCATGAYTCDTVEINLLPASRRSANNGRLGVFETSDTLPVPIKADPGWSVTFYPAMENTDMEGIYSLTFEMNKKRQ